MDGSQNISPGENQLPFLHLKNPFLFTTVFLFLPSSAIHDLQLIEVITSMLGDNVDLI